MARTKLTGKEALIKVLKDNGGGPMKVTELIAAALPLTALKGKTPGQTLAARLYTDKATFKKTARGMVKLVPEKAPAAEKAKNGNGDAKDAAPAE